MRDRLALPLAIIVIGALAFAPSAGAKRFGANLHRSANSKLTCQTVYGPDAFGNPIPYAGPFGSCTWFTISRRFNSAKEGTIVPVNRGVITSARLKVGPKTGRMRIVLLRAVSERPPSGYHSNQACCKQVKQTRAFRPRRNHITKKRLHWRLHGVTSFDPYTGLTTTGYYVLAVTVLNSSTPVPAHDTGKYQSTNGPGGSGFYPALHRGEERAGGTGVFGYITLLQGRVKR